jgi:hypothetical protein
MSKDGYFWSILITFEAGGIFEVSGVATKYLSLRFEWSFIQTTMCFIGTEYCEISEMIFRSHKITFVASCILMAVVAAANKLT